MVGSRPPRRSRDWSRRYPPLAVIIVVLILAVFALPSALNLPQANPGQTLEYAPVPGDANSSRPGGNFAGLGLGLGGSGTGSAGSGQSSDAGNGQPPQQALNGVGNIPSNKQCVGNPPRQTEDLMSPPCVAYFNGDNGGATYGGVTRSDVSVLFYFDGNTTVCTASQGANCEQTPIDQYDDMSDPPKSTDHVYTRVLRDWQHYFNARYQTYNRLVHFHVYYSPNGKSSAHYSDSPNDRRADAAANFDLLHPFAVFSQPAFGNADVYTQAMAQKGVLSFGGTNLRTASFFSSFPRLLWGFRPTVDEIAKTYSSYVCTKVVHQPVSFSGNRAWQGHPRKYGFLSTTDPDHPELQSLASQVKKQVEACGVNFGGDVATFPYAGWVQDTKYQPTYAAPNMALFKRDNVTTVLWPAGYETNQSAAADQQKYYPEWMTGGDYLMEGNLNAAAQNRNEWANARAVTPVVPTPKPSNSSAPEVNPDCLEAIQSVHPNISATDAVQACLFYDDIRQMMTGIQVAGPRLSPASVDQGFHAIPRHESSAVFTPACFYDPGDYTCVKDAIAEWFDVNGAQASGSQTGCWRMSEGGRRHIPGSWPGGNVAPLRRATLATSSQDTLTSTSRRRERGVDLRA
jgi:hypothetical protein